jgi:hypothetical protein
MREHHGGPQPIHPNRPEDAWHADQRLDIRWARILRELVDQRAELLPGRLIQV